MGLKSKGGNCTYLTDDNKCATHLDKPKTCSEWHCSPGGITDSGDSYPKLGQGWALVPGVLWDAIMDHDPNSPPPADPNLAGSS